MPFGTVASPIVDHVPMAGLVSSTTNNEAMLFIQGQPPQKDVGYLRGERKFSTYIYNGGETDLTITSLLSSGQTDGIELTCVLPHVIPPKRSYRIDFIISLEGPPVFSATYTFLSPCVFDSVLTVFGSRIPTVSGVIGYLMCEHNWSDGLTETLQWATDVMIAQDRTEQRVQLRNRARHSLSLKFTESGDTRRHLENILAARKVRFHFVPMFMDAQTLTTAVTAGSTTVTLDATNRDFEIDRWVVIWDSYSNYEIKNIESMSEFMVNAGSPFLKTWPIGSFVAPGRYANVLTSRKIKRLTDDAAEFDILAELLHETRLEGFTTADFIDGYPVLPIPISWDSPAESLDNKWVKLDNITGIVAYDIQSLEPINNRSLSFSLYGKDEIRTFKEFLYYADGRLSPFWVKSDSNALAVVGTALAGQNIITVTQMDYERSLMGGTTRNSIEFELYTGEIFRVKISTAMQTLEGNEQLTLTDVLPFNLSESLLVRKNWMELVRFDTDEFSLKWITDEHVTSSLSIVEIV